jgi:hypothetical protein
MLARALVPVVMAVANHVIVTVVAPDLHAMTHVVDVVVVMAMVMTVVMMTMVMVVAVVVVMTMMVMATVLMGGSRPDRHCAYRNGGNSGDYELAEHFLLLVADV